MTMATDSRGTRQCRWGGLLLALVLMPAAAQYIQIPDFRKTVPSVSSRPAEPCNNCGVIRAIRETQSQRPVTVPQGLQNPSTMSGGADTSVLVGAVVAIPMSEGSDQAFVGGLGTPEMRARFTESNYEITVLLDNGAYAVAQRRDGALFKVGDRVRMRGIELERLTP